MTLVVQARLVPLDPVATVLRDAPLGSPEAVHAGLGRWLQQLFAATAFGERHAFLDMILEQAGIDTWLGDCAALPEPRQRYGLTLYLLSTLGLREPPTPESAVGRERLLARAADTFTVRVRAVRDDTNRMIGLRRRLRERWKAHHSSADDEKMDGKGRAYQ